MKQSLYLEGGCLLSKIGQDLYNERRKLLMVSVECMGLFHARFGGFGSFNEVLDRSSGNAIEGAVRTNYR